MRAAKPTATTFVNVSGVKFNTISGNDFSFYEELDAVVQSLRLGGCELRGPV